MRASLPSFYTLGPLPEISLGFVSLPTYYLVISLTYCVCILWFYKRCEDRHLSQKHAMDIGLILLIAGFVGARLFHILFELPTHYLQNPVDIFYFWQGGFVFYGGFLTAYLCAFLYAKKLKLTFWLWHDTLAPILAFGYAMGRSACFLVGCCYGKICDWPWALPLKQIHIETGHTASLLRHPTPLYAVFLELLILFFLLAYEKKKPLIMGSVFLLWLLLHSLSRFVMEIFRDDPRGAFFYGWSISMIISAGLAAISVIVLLLRKRNQEVKA